MSTPTGAAPAGPAAAPGPLPAAGLALAALALLPVLPRRLHLGEGGAPVLGFDPAVAHLLLTAAAAACVLLYAALGWRSAPVPAAPPPATARVPVAAVAGVLALVLLAYFPPFLARYGPYGEDKYFLSALLRSVAGQRPYADYEFLYGPLLVQPLAAWFRAFGFSLQSYYWFLALVEAATFAAATYALLRFVPGRRARIAALAALAVLLVNDNLGLSWSAVRRLLPVVVLVVHARLAARPRGWLATGALLGVLMVLSLEYAIAVAAAVVAVAGLEAVAARRAAPLVRGLAAAGAGVAAGGVLALALLGANTGAWLAATWRIITLRGGGEAGFPFAPSVNALAVFLLLFLGCAWLGAGLRRLAATPPAAGDRLLALAVAYAVVAFKSGLARSDMYHLVPPVLGLAAVLVLPLPFAALAPGPRQRRLGLAVLALVCLSYAPGLAGAGRLWVRGLVLGARDVLAGVPANGIEPAVRRGPRIGAENTEPDPAAIALTEFLGHPDRARAPVLFYGPAWGADRMTGVAKPVGVYPTDDYLVSDAEGEALARFLAATPEALVVIDTASWRHLGDPGGGPPRDNMYWIGGERSWAIRALEWWSSSHFGTATLDERVRKRERWARTVGRHLVAGYRPLAAVGRWQVLARAGGG